MTESPQAKFPLTAKSHPANVTSKKQILSAPSDEHLGEAYFFLGEMKFRQNRLEEAAAALEKTVSLFPAKYDARFALARIYMNLNKVREAEEQVKQLEGVHLERSRQMILAGLKKSIANLKARSGNIIQ